MAAGLKTQQAIDEAVTRIAQRFAPDRIVLFGSHARGEAGADSDADLLVVMRVNGSKRDAATAIDLVLGGIAIPLDIIVVTPEEVEKYKDCLGTIIYEALREGAVVYDRAA